MSIYFTIFTTIVIYSIIFMLYFVSELIKENKNKTKNLYICIDGELQGLTMTLNHWKTRAILLIGDVDDGKVIENMTSQEFILYLKNNHNLIIKHI